MAALALAAIPAACGGPAGPVDGDRAYSHAAAIVAFGPRPPGSKGLENAAQYIKRELEALGLEPREQTWKETVKVYGAEREVAFRNLWTEIPGDDPDGGPIVLIAAHYDSKRCTGHPNPDHNFRFVGALDSAASCGLMLELARHLKERPPPRPANVWLVWFDGEESLEFEWNDDIALFGSRHFAETLPKETRRRVEAMVLMDLLGDPELKIDRDLASSKELLEIFGAAAEELGEGERMYRFESPMKDDHIPFRKYGISVIDLIDFKKRVPSRHRTEEPEVNDGYTAWWHTPHDTMEHVAAGSLAFVGNLVWTALPAIEKMFR